MKTLKVTWVTKKAKKATRINAMYCFKSCEKNKN